MSKVVLTEVSDLFEIRGLGLVVAPNFDVPNNGVWENLITNAELEAPDGTCFKVEATFSLSHFNIKDSSSELNDRWRVVLSISGVEKENVAKGSKIMVSKETKKRVLGENT